MKKLMCVVLAGAVIMGACACNKKDSRRDSGRDSGRDSVRDDSAVVQDDDDDGSAIENFRLENRGTMISGLSDIGKTKETITLPAGYEISGDLRGGVVKHVYFESDDDIELWSFFCNNETLETVELPANMTKMCYISSCPALKEITIPKGVTRIPTTCFSLDESLETVTILGDVTEIEPLAFRDCKSLRYINLPDSLTEVGRKAFYGCKNLEELTLPKNLKVVGDMAFADIGLKVVTVPEEMELEKWDTAAFIQKEPYTVRVKEGSWADENFERVFAGPAVKEYY